MSLLDSFIEVSRVAGTDIRPGDIFLFDTPNIIQSEIKFKSLEYPASKWLTVKSVNIVKNYGDNSLANDILKYCGGKDYKELGIITSATITLEFVEENSPSITLNAYSYYTVKKVN